VTGSTRCRSAAPTPGQQQRIADVLSAIDEAIEQTEALFAETQKIRPV
jgi:hypothetical protein